MKSMLNGVRVLDLTQAYSGPFCCMHLADHGADVIKIEPPMGDQSRYWAPIKNNNSGYFAYMNRNKKGIVLNLKTDDGKDALKRLIRNSDVIVENFKVGTFERLGFSYDTLKEINPKIIYASISGYGLQGPKANRPGYDIVTQAESGLMSITGYPDKDPVKTGPAFADSFSGTYLALGIMMALYNRERTGEGARIDVSLFDTLFSAMEEKVMYYTLLGQHPTRTGNCALSGAPWDSYKAKDGMFVIACGTEKLWQHFTNAMGMPELKENPKFLRIINRWKNYDELKATIESWSTQHTLDEIEAACVAEGVPFGKVNSLWDVVESDDVKARNMLCTIYDPGFEEDIRMPGSPIKIHGESDDPRSAAPMLGQDTDTILKEIAGYSDEELSSMRNNGAIN